MKINGLDFVVINYDDISSNYLINREGKIYNCATKAFLNGSLDKDGYRRVSLIRADGSTKTYRVHRLVLITFNPTDNLDLQVNHIDGNKLNNTVENLEWVTAQENINHAFKIGLRDGLERAILSIPQVHEICHYLEQGYAPKMIAQKMFPDEIERYASIIHDIKRRKNWEEISKDYNFNVPYKYGESFKSSYTIWEIENICAFLANKLDNKSNVDLAREYFKDPSINYKDTRVKLFGDIKRKHKYTNVSKYYF